MVRLIALRARDAGRQPQPRLLAHIVRQEPSGPLHEEDHVVVVAVLLDSPRRALRRALPAVAAPHGFQQNVHHVPPLRLLVELPDADVVPLVVLVVAVRAYEEEAPGARYEAGAANLCRQRNLQPVPALVLHIECVKLVWPRSQAVEDLLAHNRAQDRPDRVPHQRPEMVGEKRGEGVQRIELHFVGAPDLRDGVEDVRDQELDFAAVGILGFSPDFAHDDELVGAREAVHSEPCDAENAERWVELRWQRDVAPEARHRVADHELGRHGAAAVRVPSRAEADQPVGGGERGSVVEVEGEEAERNAEPFRDLHVIREADGSCLLLGEGEEPLRAWGLAIDLAEADESGRADFDLPLLADGLHADDALEREARHDALKDVFRKGLPYVALHQHLAGRSGVALPLVPLDSETSNPHSCHCEP